MKALIVLVLTLACANQVWSTTHKFTGTVELSLSSIDSTTSYLDAGYGKFDLSDGNDISLSQLAGHYQVDWQENWQANLVVNAYSDDLISNIDLTEAYLRYQGLPNDSGYRFVAKIGIFYPSISLDNNAIGWSSTKTINYATINSWLAEEVRQLGTSFTLTRLGRFSNSPYDISLSVDLLSNNDTTGALLSWHGWVSSNKQTGWFETIELPPFPALADGHLTNRQALESDPFVELDDRVGAMLNLKWQQRGKFETLLGFYNNNADTRVVVAGQYAWLTRFFHFGQRLKLSDQWQMTGQFMTGYTQMNAPNGMVVVEGDFQSAYLMFTGQYTRHQLSGRIEEFSFNDRDGLTGDNNDEYGKAATVSYRYQIDRQWYAFVEWNKIQSNRPSRYYVHSPVKLSESQWQVAIRYYF